MCHEQVSILDAAQAEPQRASSSLDRAARPGAHLTLVDFVSVMTS